MSHTAVLLLSIVASHTCQIVVVSVTIKYALMVYSSLNLCRIGLTKIIHQPTQDNDGQCTNHVKP
jgi:hypothetical protein